MEYTADLWNIVDFITNFFYLMWLSLRISSWYIVNVRNNNNLFFFSVTNWLVIA